MGCILRLTPAPEIRAFVDLQPLHKLSSGVFIELVAATHLAVIRHNKTLDAVIDEE
jgi:hypothetical protein